MEPLTGKGSVEARLGVVERLLYTLVGLVLHHDRYLRQLDREANIVLEIMVENVISKCLMMAKEAWDKERIPGKPHPSKKGFREIGWDLLWSLATQSVQTAQAQNEIDPDDAAYIMETISVLRDNLAGVALFYAVQLRPREDSEQNRKEETSEMETETEKRQAVAQIWVIRFTKDEAGGRCLDALNCLSTEKHLYHLMDAQIRTDRAPAGSMAKALAAAFAKTALGNAT